MCSFILKQETNRVIYPVGVLDDIFPDRGQCGPFAVVDGFGGAAFVHFAFADLARESMAGDSAESIPTYVAVGWAGMGSGIPVMVTGKAVWLVGFVEAALGSGSEGAEPVLHLAAGLGTQHQGSERGDHLKTQQSHLRKKDNMFLDFYCNRNFLKYSISFYC